MTGVSVVDRHGQEIAFAPHTSACVWVVAYREGVAAAVFTVRRVDGALVSELAAKLAWPLQLQRGDAMTVYVGEPRRG